MKKDNQNITLLFELLQAITRSLSLEDAFLHLTGKTIREEEAGHMDRLRIGRRLHRR